MSTLMKFYLAPHTLQFEAGGDYPANRVTKVFQVKDRTAGGTLQVETLGITTRTRTIVFNEMSLTDYTALIDWFIDVVNAGELTFEFTDEYGDVFPEARIINSELDFNETSLELYSGSLDVEY